MPHRYKFNRLEVAGSLGDLGTLLPLVIGLVMINGLNPTGSFVSIGLLYVLSGWYFGVTVAVQPMKVIGAYAIATAMSSSQIMASSLLMGAMLLLVGMTNAIDLLGRYIPKAVIRGVQLSTGVMLMTQGVRFMVGSTKFQLAEGLAEPYLRVQALGPIPVGIVIGVVGGALTLLLLENRKFPAGLVVIVAGLGLGLALGTHEGWDRFELGFHLPDWMPFGFPAKIDFTFALFALALPQLPMTLGNAVIANGDLSRQYFGDVSSRVTYRALTISIGLSNLVSFLLGGMPLCHGAGGLAAHYRFGARTAGSNMIIGVIFLLLGLLCGVHALALVYLLPLSILGILLIFAGAQLALTILDLTDRKDLFVPLLMLGITLATNLAIAFLVGIGVAWVIRSPRYKI